MKKIINLFIRFLLLLLLCVAVLYFFTTRGYSYNVDITDEPYINQIVTMDFETTLNKKPYDAFEVDIEVFNKYNKNETYLFENIPAYKKGHYFIAFNPQFSGTYIVNVSITSEEGSNPQIEQFDFIVN